ncbi:hypothetical protein CONPUDRAFT_100974 [Coniophora puteana RWD-64-598 SS2]|uniref:Uncharacterized protein n=1 Tax=Coniophora puteana (strain RWD-64-598) TaxID=741705 RepID=A0A5M3MVC1_CONPW|nr:uncharacterized protein CONPUDRAFT_100974 [Coniophora puteana RWD-64-598 SS2]EIW82674.1 hypothetical protein CONPUDRAFT_100974 [Coniophora puteana RWD-64-598 SS2]
MNTHPHHYSNMRSQGHIIYAAYRSPYKPHTLRDYLWKKRLMVETTLATSVMEPWEKLTFLTVLFILVCWVCTGLWRYIPAQMLYTERRLTYYLWGHAAGYH